MNNGLKLLTELQAKDIHVDGINDQLEELPLQIEELNQKLEEEKQSFEHYRTEGKHFSLTRKEKEGDLTAKEDEIQKHNKELNSIKTNEAYKVMLNKIEQTKQEKNVVEDEILELMEKADEFNKKIKTVEVEFKEKDSGVKKQVAELQAQIEAFNNELKKCEEERMEFAKNIPEQELRQYEHIRNGKDGLAIVPIEDKTSCSGCHYKLPPQVVNDVIRGRDVVVCDQCSRILYCKSAPV